MKYLRYIGIILFTPFRKVFGIVWYFVAVPFRSYANNVVFNYALDDKVYLKRLLERPIYAEADRYIIQPYHGTNGGYIIKRKVSRIEFALVYWLIWGWLDSDTNDDTFDYGHVFKLRYESSFFDWLLKDVRREQYGNRFDLGDARKPSFHFWASYLWTCRNTAYNFRYVQFESLTDTWCINLPFFGWKLGWLKDSDSDNYSLVFLGWR